MTLTIQPRGTQNKRLRPIQSSSYTTKTLNMFKQLYTQSRLGLDLRISVLRKAQTDTVDTVSLIGRRVESLALENVPKMTATVVANNLGPLHAKGVIDMSLHGTGDRIKVSGPATARLELVVGSVEGRITAGAVIDTL